MKNGIAQTTGINKSIGHHMNSKIANSFDWYDHYPVVDKNGIIRKIIDADVIPEDAILVEWSTNRTDGHIVRLDNDQVEFYGFEAILEE